MSVPKVSTIEAGRDPLTGDLVPHERSEAIAGQVTAMAALGFNSDEIAVALDLRPGQVRHYYERELQSAGIKANMQVAAAFHKVAVKGDDWRASHAWLKARAGWEESDKQAGNVIAIHIHV